MLSQKGKWDRHITIADVAELLATHVHTFGGTIDDLMNDVLREAQEALWDIQDDEAQDRANEERADREGARY